MSEDEGGDNVFLFTTATVDPALATIVPMQRERMNWEHNYLHQEYHQHPHLYHRHQFSTKSEQQQQQVNQNSLVPERLSSTSSINFHKDKQEQLD